MGRSSASTSLAPGFRFHPTDEELVWYYLRRKVCGKPFRLDAISEIDIYKAEPWDLPGLSKLKSRDLEWYFFSALDRKYGNGSKTNRATGEGYWKTTGKDRPVNHRAKVVGMKKTLVYHKGRAPRGERTNWVMHEYRLIDEALEDAGYSPDGFVLCRVFQKSGTGPKNGEKYGAPLVEEEWEDDNAEIMVPSEVSFEDPYVDDDAYIEQNDLDQVLDLQLMENVPSLVNINCEDSNNNLEDSRDITGTDQKSAVGESEDNFGLPSLEDQNFYDLHAQAGSSECMVKNEHMAQPNNASNEAFVNLTSELFSEVGNAPVDDGLFLDAVDFLEPAQENPLDGVLGPYLDDDIDIGPYLNFDSPPELMGADDNQAFSTLQNLDDAAWQIPSASQLPGAGDDGIASSSNPIMEVPDAKPSKSDIQYPFLSQASRLLGNIPAPQAFASELPSKDMAERLSAAVEPSSSVHVTAGMVRIRDMPTGASGSGLQWSLDKTGNVNIVLSFDLPQGVNPAGLESLSGMVSSKMAAAASRGWLYSLFFWVLVAVSIKIGTCIFAK